MPTSIIAMARQKSMNGTACVCMATVSSTFRSSTSRGAPRMVAIVSSISPRLGANDRRRSSHWSIRPCLLGVISWPAATLASISPTTSRSRVWA